MSVSLIDGHIDREEQTMTDNEIIKALKCCINDDCDNCPDTFGNCEQNAMRKALDLINRQKAENEELISKLDELESEYTFYKISAQEQIESLIAGQETLQKALNEKIAEVERLRNILLRFMDEVAKWENEKGIDVSELPLIPICDEGRDIIDHYRAKAIKEFAERLKENKIDIDVSFGYGREVYTEAVAVIEIDNLVKEMAPTILNDKGEQNK